MIFVLKLQLFNNSDDTVFTKNAMIRDICFTPLRHTYNTSPLVQIWTDFASVSALIGNKTIQVSTVTALSSLSIRHMFHPVNTWNLSLMCHTFYYCLLLFTTFYFCNLCFTLCQHLLPITHVSIEEASWSNFSQRWYLLYLAMKQHPI